MEVGEYIRTQNGRIGRVIKIWIWERTSKRKEQTHYLIDWGGKASYIAILKNLKHSKNIIDLIEYQDILEIFTDDNKTEKIVIYGDELNALKSGDLILEDIKSIVTKEQYESIKYEVNNENI